MRVCARALGRLLGICLAIGLAADTVSVVAAPGSREPAPERRGPVNQDAASKPLRRVLHAGVIADTDADGVVSPTEAETFFKARFWAMDANRDGQLEAAEFVSSELSERKSARTLRAGRSGAPAFADLDLDGDGALSPEEFQRAVALRQDRSPSAKLLDPAWRQIVFRQLDGDGDGRVSEAQFLAAGIRHFADSDRDGDGAVSVWEFLAAPGF